MGTWPPRESASNSAEVARSRSPGAATGAATGARKARLAGVFESRRAQINPSGRAKTAWLSGSGVQRCRIRATGAVPVLSPDAPNEAPAGHVPNGHLVARARARHRDPDDDRLRRRRRHPVARLPLGVELEEFIRREDAERFIAEVRGDDPEIAAKLRIEERELAVGLQPSEV